MRGFSSVLAESRSSISASLCSMLGCRRACLGSHASQTGCCIEDFEEGISSVSTLEEYRRSQEKKNQKYRSVSKETAAITKARK
jgi:hypothetical protein